MARNTDQLLLKYQRPKTLIVFGSAASDNDGKRQTCTGTYRDECFALADAAGKFPNGHVASRLAVETAVWGYRHIRLKRYYWQDKRLFIRRIYRSVNIAVWQKTRETGFGEGLACSLAVVMVGTKNVWIGNVGNTHVCLFRGGKPVRQTTDDVDAYGQLRKMVGLKRYGLLPQYVSTRLMTGDTVVVATHGITKIMSDTDIAAAVGRDLTTDDACTAAAERITARSAVAGATDRQAVLVICRTENAEAGRVSHLSTESAGL